MKRFWLAFAMVAASLAAAPASARADEPAPSPDAGTSVAAAGDAGAPAPPSAPPLPDAFRAQATFTAERIHVDGKLDEAVWQSAPILTDFHQTRINPGAPAVEQTEVRILYDRDNIYFGIHCLDSRPDKITAYTVQNEAFLHQEDNVTIIIDTFNDHRNAYYFWTNALGVRTDGRIVDDGEAFSTEWQGEWESAGAIVKDGWIAEVRIPFSNFQFDGGDEHTFGLLLDREEARLQEWSNWTAAGANSAKVSRYAHVDGLRGIQGKSTYGLSVYAASDVTLGPGHRPALMPNGGFDLRYSPVPWGSLKLTVNPDYAQVDVDQDVLWLSPEKRQLIERRSFFLEGRDLFVSPINLFYSRQIAPRRDDRVLGGLQVVGKHDGLGFTAFDTQTLEHRPNGGGLEDVNAGVLRLQKDIGKRSSVSMLAMSRKGDVSNGVVGVDANLHVIEELFVLAQAAKSFSPGPRASAEAFHLELHRYETTSEFWIQYEDIGRNFNDPLGYIPVVDDQSVYGHFTYSWFTESKRLLPRIDFTYDDIWRFNHAGMQTRHLRDFAVEPYVNENLALTAEAKFDQVQSFDNRVGYYGFVLFPNDWQSLTVSGLRGEFYGGDLIGASGALNLKVGPHVALKTSLFATRSWNLPENSPLRVKNGHDGYQYAFYGQLRYQFHPDLYARLTFQQGDAVGITDFSTVGGRVIDAVLGWHYRLGSDFFLVYTQQPLDGVQQHLFLAKVSYTL